MTVKAGWEKSSNGPDWTDVESMMRAIGVLHSADVAIVVSPLGTGFSGGVSVVASALFQRLPGSSLPGSVCATAEWPSNTHKRLQDAAYNLLYQLDFEISKVYKQESLWK